MVPTLCVVSASELLFVLILFLLASLCFSLPHLTWFYLPVSSTHLLGLCLLSVSVSADLPFAVLPLSLPLSVPPSPMSPSQAARHSHVAVAWAGSLVLMGGELADGSLTSDVWAFSPLGGGHWELLAPPASSSSGPPGLAGHAAALVDDVWLYVSGGRTQHDLFSSGLFRFRLDSPSGGYWEKVIPAGGRPPAATGHSMVFHEPSRALLVHGGHRPSTAR